MDETVHRKSFTYVYIPANINDPVELLTFPEGKREKEFRERLKKHFASRLMTASQQHCFRGSLEQSVAESVKKNEMRARSKKGEISSSASGEAAEGRKKEEKEKEEIGEMQKEGREDRKDRRGERESDCEAKDGDRVDGMKQQEEEDGEEERRDNSGRIVATTQQSVSLMGVINGERSSAAMTLQMVESATNATADGSYQIIPLTLPCMANGFHAVNCYVDSVGLIKQLDANARASRLTSDDIHGDCFVSKTFDDEIGDFERRDLSVAEYEDMLQSPPDKTGRWDQSKALQSMMATAPTTSNTTLYGNQHSAISTTSTDTTAESGVASSSSLRQQLEVLKQLKQGSQTASASSIAKCEGCGKTADERLADSSTGENNNKKDSILTNSTHKPSCSSPSPSHHPSPSHPSPSFTKGSSLHAQQLRLKKCGRCAKVAYCSVECQRADWRFHKRICTQSALNYATNKHV